MRKQGQCKILVKKLRLLAARQIKEHEKKLGGLILPLA